MEMFGTLSHPEKCIMRCILFLREDEWLCAALDCLDYLPDQPVVELSRELPPCFAQDHDSPSYSAAGSGNANETVTT